MGSKLCAPQRLGATNFLPEDAPSLDQAVRMPQAGHAQFWDAGRVWQGTYDNLCGTGSESDGTIRSWTARLLSSWLLRTFPPQIGKVRVPHMACLLGKPLQGEVGCSDW